MQERDFEQLAVFTVGDAIKTAKVNRRRILLLLEQKVVDTSLPSAGRGNARRFSFLDLVRVRIAADLERMGLAPRFLRKILARFTDLELAPTEKDDAPALALISEAKRGFTVTFHSELTQTMAILAGEDIGAATISIRVPVRAITSEVRKGLGLRIG
ncbi:MAG: hypothetical protein CME24_12195 [Gemmatimonadetes bacterium]|nr:hypothetical protein [Gemmatimonadota bacterium]